MLTLSFFCDSINIQNNEGIILFKVPTSDLEIDIFLYKKPSYIRFLGSACFVFPLFIRQLFQRPINKLVYNQFIICTHMVSSSYLF